MMESNMQSGGAVLFWSIGDATRVDALRLAFERAGFADQAPDYRAAATVAGEALGDLLGGPLTSLTPTEKRRGWFGARIERGSDRNVFHDWFTLDLSTGGAYAEPAVDVPRYRLAMTWHAHRSEWMRKGEETTAVGDLETRILDRFAELAPVARTGQVTGALVDVVDRMNGTRLRPSGGLYWMPQGPALDRFAELARQVEAAATLGTESRVYIIRHALDVDALRAVRDALTAEVEREAAELRDLVASGELGVRGCQSQEVRAKALAAKVAEYEALMGERLPTLAQIADDARTAAAMARLQAGAAATRAAGDAGQGALHAGWK